MSELHRYITFDHGTDPLDADLADHHENYQDATKGRAPGQGIAALVFEYTETEIVDESYAICEDCGSANCRKVDPDGCEDCDPDPDEPPAPSFIVGNVDGQVQIDGQPVDIGPSLELAQHSPTGFSWGYHGSGPAQLALAVLLHLGATEAEAMRWYQHFKTQFVSRWAFERPFFQLVGPVRAWMDGRRASEAA